MVQLLSLSDRTPSLFFLVHMHMTNDSFFHYHTILPHSQWQNQKKTREAGRRTWWSRTRNVSKLFSFPGLEGIDQPKWHYLVSVLDLILLKGREVGLFFMSLESECSSRDGEVDAFRERSWEQTGGMPCSSRVRYPSKMKYQRFSPAPQDKLLKPVMKSLLLGYKECRKHNVGADCSCIGAVGFCQPAKEREEIEAQFWVLSLWS